MWNWFKRIVKNQRNKYVFHYWDGSKKRSVDPLQVERGLISILGKNWREQLEDLAKPVHPELVGEEADLIRQQKEDQRSKVLYAIDASFDVQPYKDGYGLTEYERFGLLAGFTKFCVDLVVLARPFLKQQSRASPGSVSQPTASGVESI